MFGLVVPDFTSLTQTDTDRYNSFYCGLCRNLGNRYGQISRLALSYDLTFLAILLTSLYEPDEASYKKICPIHPFRSKCYLSCKALDYAADMTVVLTWYKCMDDWQDDKKHLMKKYADTLLPSFENVRAKHPAQCKNIYDELQHLQKIEADCCSVPDEPANCFGRLLASVFTWKNDNWSDLLYQIGYSLGKYIYLADALFDFDKDIKKGSYNPFKVNYPEKSDIQFLLAGVLAPASAAFERLPIVQDETILRNILYSGLWYKVRKKGFITDGH